MHRIRLRKPWLKQIGDQFSKGVDVPDLIDPIPGEKLVRYQRSFNQPTGLTPNDSVFLNITKIHGKASVIEINGKPCFLADVLAHDFPIRVNITKDLLPHNKIDIVLEFDTSVSPLLRGEVYLEIESPAAVSQHGEPAQRTPQ